MIQLVLYGLLFSAIAIDASPAGREKVALNVAAEARRLVHQANWAAVATISAVKSIEGYPMATVLSTADSDGATSAGDIYFYMLGFDMATMDTNKDNRITFLFSDAQEGVCNKRGDDPWSHQCARAMISGQVKKLDEGTEEHTRGLAAFLSRHPKASDWSRSGPHRFYLCKLDITNVFVFSGYSGYQNVTPEEYHAGTDSVAAKDV